MAALACRPLVSNRVALTVLAAQPPSAANGGGKLRVFRRPLDVNDTSMRPLGKDSRACSSRSRPECSALLDRCVQGMAARSGDRPLSGNIALGRGGKFRPIAGTQSIGFEAEKRSLDPYFATRLSRGQDANTASLG